MCDITQTEFLHPAELRFLRGTSSGVHWPHGTHYIESEKLNVLAVMKRISPSGEILFTATVVQENLSSKEP